MHPLFREVTVFHAEFGVFCTYRGVATCGRPCNRFKWLEDKDLGNSVTIVTVKIVVIYSKTEGEKKGKFSPPTPFLGVLTTQKDRYRPFSTTPNTLHLNDLQKVT